MHIIMCIVLDSITCIQIHKSQAHSSTVQILGSVTTRQHMLSEVEARHLEILRLEENIRVSLCYIRHWKISNSICLPLLFCNLQELHDMFYDLALLVHDQVTIM